MENDATNANDSRIHTQKKLYHTPCQGNLHHNNDKRPIN